MSTEHEPASLPRIVVLTGPTGVGKTALAVDLVERFGGEVVSADSRQVYKYLDIGTAKPSPDELARAPHHLVDYVDPAEPFSVTRYREDADRVLDDLAARGQIAWVVGGSWHYIQALIDRIEPPQVPPRPELRAELEREAAERRPGGAARPTGGARPGRRRDDRAAQRPPGDPGARSDADARAAVLGGRPRAREPLPAVRMVLSMPRAEVYARVDARVDAMIAAGWLDEVRGLIARGYDESMPSLSSHGYREMMAVGRGTMTLEEAAQKTKWAIHAYVRRQDLWLKKQPEYHWIAAGPDALGAATRLVEPYLESHMRA